MELELQNRSNTNTYNCIHTDEELSSRITLHLSNINKEQIKEEEEFKKIDDIYQRASTAMIEHKTQGLNISLKELLDPFVQELANIIINFEDALSLDGKYFGCDNLNKSNYWRRDFGYPNVGEIVNVEYEIDNKKVNHQFCVMSHGLLTMKMAYCIDCSVLNELTCQYLKILEEMDKKKQMCESDESDELDQTQYDRYDRYGGYDSDCDNSIYYGGDYDSNYNDDGDHCYVGSDCDDYDYYDGYDSL